jgi:hypothetical protein
MNQHDPVQWSLRHNKEIPMEEYVQVEVKNHPARVSVFNLHRSSCRYASSGTPTPTTLADYAVGTRMTRSSVPAKTGWEFGRNAARGNPHAPAWVSADALRLTCGHCFRNQYF